MIVQPPDRSVTLLKRFYMHAAQYIILVTKFFASSMMKFFFNSHKLSTDVSSDGNDRDFMCTQAVYVCMYVCVSVCSVPTAMWA